jgi:hypothetical protein
MVGCPGTFSFRWRMPPSGMLGHVALLTTDVSEDRIISMRVTKIGELGTMIAVTSNRSTLRRNTIARQCLSH